jgi:Flp pilus assembly protein CpaB
MEMEYKDPSKKGRWIVLLGVVLAVVAGASAFFLVNNAQQQAGTTGQKMVSGFVAVRAILAHKAIVAEDIALRTNIPLDDTNAVAITDAAKLVGRLSAVDVAPGQLMTSNLLSSATAGLGFSIIPPDASVAPGDEAWRAVSVTVPDDRAVGGVLGATMSVDVFVTAAVTVPELPRVVSGDPAATPAPAVSALSGFTSAKSTKITYQGMTILARSGTYYILKVPLLVAEEINHLQAEGGAMFSLALRPEQDYRIVDVSQFGATNNRIIKRYGLPIPEVYPTLNGPRPSNPPISSLPPLPTPSFAPAQQSAPPAG